MGVKVREKEKDSGIWWVFINNKGRRSSRQVGTKKAAEKVKEHIEARLKLGQWLPEETEKTLPTVQEFFDSTFKPNYINNRGRVTESTGDITEGTMTRHVLPFFGSTTLDRVADNIEGFFAHLCSTVPRQSKDENAKLMKNTIQAIRARARIFMDAAIDKYSRQGLTVNPFAGRKVNKYYRNAKRAKTINPFTAEEAALFLETARMTEPTDYCLYLVLFKTGMRDGEVVALKESDIDWKGSRIHVQRIIERVTGEERDGTKTKLDRWVRVTEDVLTAIRIHLVEQAERFEMKGKPKPEYLFTNSVGNRVDISNLRRLSWTRVLKRTGLAWRKIHETRHTFASLLINAGVNPAFVQKQLGHANVELTLKKYSHYLPSDDREEAALKNLDVMMSTAPAAVEGA